MKSESLRIAKLFQNGGDIHYVLPLFQREYTWEKPQWQTLLQDALAIHDEMQTAPEDGASKPPDVEHFLGSIVVINDGTRNGTVPAFQVVDGQQRLTSLSLLLCALGRAVEKPPAGFQKRIRRLLLNLDEEGDVRFKLLPTSKYGDRAAYTALVGGEEAAPPTDSRVPLAFDYFLKELTQRIAGGSVNPERLFLALTQAFQVVFIDLNRDESPYRIFESLNAKGKPLSQADLVRNYLAMRLSPTGQEKVFDGQWAHVEALLQERRVVGRSRLGELTAFLRHYLAMHTGVLCSEEHVYARFRDRAEREYATEQEFADEVAVLRRFAEFYDHLLRPEGEASPAASAVLAALNVLEASTAYPFLLAAYDARQSGALTEVQWLGMLQSLENYLVRRYLAGEPTNYLNKMFPGLWAQVDAADPVSSLRVVLGGKGYPSDARLRQRLETRQLYDASALTRTRTGLVLERVNRHLSAGSGGYTVLSGSATIEHVLPQSPDEDWTDTLGPDAERILQDSLHNLGNLTLVTQDWNSSLSNRSFAIKKQRLAGHALKLNSDYFGRDIPEWDEDAIRERATWLTDQIVAVWPPLTQEGASKSVSAAASYHQECVERVSAFLGEKFIKQGSISYASADGTDRLICAVSKQYVRSGQSFYWYAFHPSQNEFLADGRRAHVVYGCGSAEKVVLIPFETFLPWVGEMNQSVKGERHYWHVHIHEVGGKLLLALSQGRKLDITEFLLGGAVK